MTKSKLPSGHNELSRLPISESAIEIQVGSNNMPIPRSETAVPIHKPTCMEHVDVVDPGVMLSGSYITDELSRLPRADNAIEVKVGPHSFSITRGVSGNPAYNFHMDEVLKALGSKGSVFASLKAGEKLELRTGPRGSIHTEMIQLLSQPSGTYEAILCDQNGIPTGNYAPFSQVGKSSDFHYRAAVIATLPNDLILMANGPKSTKHPLGLYTFTLDEPLMRGDEPVTAAARAVFRAFGVNANYENLGGRLVPSNKAYYGLFNAQLLETPAVDRLAGFEQVRRNDLVIRAMNTPNLYDSLFVEIATQRITPRK